MRHEEVKNRILTEKLVVLFRRVPLEQMAEVSKALVRGGVKLLEVTFDQQAEDPAALYTRSLEIVREAVGDELCLGAGTVLTPEQVRAAKAAGAEFILAPNTDPQVISLTRELGMVSVPGAMTPSEIVAAWNCGADIVKLFPADDLGYHYIWNIRGPLPHIPLLATGGVNPRTIPEFLKHGVNAVGTGVSIIDRELLKAGDYAGIEELARAHVNAVAEFRK
ncbi:MAG: bifunctional 4-hydroxy-2-oxoglutarate aldolase/2-dehydro-3-deoxy-phosphogluconate aldolase [Faecousia sp.]